MTPVDFPTHTITMYEQTRTAAKTYLKADNNLDSQLYASVAAHLRPIDGAFDMDGNQGFLCFLDIADAPGLSPLKADKYRVNDGTYNYKTVSLEKNYTFNRWELNLVRKKDQS